MAPAPGWLMAGSCDAQAAGLFHEIDSWRKSPAPVEMASSVVPQSCQTIFGTVPPAPVYLGTYLSIISDFATAPFGGSVANPDADPHTSPMQLSADVPRGNTE